MEWLVEAVTRPMRQTRYQSVRAVPVPLSVHLAFGGVFVALIGLAFFISTLGGSSSPIAESPKLPAWVATGTAQAVPKDMAANIAYAGMTVVADSAIVVDLTDGTVLFEKSSDTVHALASVTKLMTAVVAAERLPKNATVVVDSDDLAPEGESNFIVGDQWSLANLLSFTLISSSNDGARALATAAGALSVPEGSPSEAELQPFIDSMNAKARTLGMDASIFRNETGLDVSGIEPGAEGTARDVATLLSYIHQTHPDLLFATVEEAMRYKSQSGAAYRAVNTNTIVRDFPGLLGSKTGYTDLAGGNLAIVFDADINRPVAVVVLGSTYDARFTDAERLAEAAFSYYRTLYP